MKKQLIETGTLKKSFIVGENGKELILIGKQVYYDTLLVDSHSCDSHDWKHRNYPAYNYEATKCECCGVRSDEYICPHCGAAKP